MYLRLTDLRFTILVYKNSFRRSFARCKGFLKDIPCKMRLPTLEADFDLRWAFHGDQIKELCVHTFTNKESGKCQDASRYRYVSTNSPEVTNVQFISKNKYFRRVILRPGILFRLHSDMFIKYPGKMAQVGKPHPISCFGNRQLLLFQ